MSATPDDWKKPRSHGDHLTETEIEFIRAGHKNNQAPRDIARELKCSTRVVFGYFARWGEPPPKRPMPAPAPVKQLFPHGPTFWTTERDDALIDAWPTDEEIEELAERLGTTPSVVGQRAFNLGLAVRSGNSHSGAHDVLSFRGQDEKFQQRMLSAIERGLEHCKVGVDTRPGTKRPQYIPHAPTPHAGMSSPAGQIAE